MVAEWDDLPDNIEPPVTFQEIHYWISKMEYWEHCWGNLLAKYGSKTLTVYYEDLMHNLKGTVRRWPLTWDVSWRKVKLNP